MHIGQKWHCVDPKCRAELIVTESSRLVDVDKPRCGCGAEMKREYEKPALRRAVASTCEGQGGMTGNKPAWG